jgi:hypothetical protein
MVQNGAPVASCFEHGDEPLAVTNGVEIRLTVILLPAE